jgi:hypothetical protein
MALSVSRGAWAKRGIGGASAAANLVQWAALVRHSPWTVPTAGVSVIAVALAVWWAVASAARPGGTPAVALPIPPPNLAVTGDPLRAEIVIFNVEDSFGRAALRQRDTDGDDTALFQRLEASAAPPPDLKKLIAPGTQLVLGPVVKAAALEKLCRSGRAVKVDDTFEFEYYTEFSMGREAKEVFPAFTETMNVGTAIELEAGTRGRDGSRLARLKFENFFAPPAMRKWPVQVREDGEESDVGPEQPDFQIAAGTSQVVTSPGQPALAASLLLPPPLVATDPTAAPRRLLVFLTLREESQPQ